MHQKNKNRFAFWGVTVLVLAEILCLVWAQNTYTVLRVSWQKTGETILEVPAAPGDTVTVRLTHSFEHVPWNEYYTVTDDLKFNLDRIEVGGYGAGIPAEMDVTSYVGDDGLVHMDDINSTFDKFTWITSSINMKDLSLNGESVLAFSDLPHHSFVQCEITTKRGFFFG